MHKLVSLLGAALLALTGVAALGVQTASAVPCVANAAPEACSVPTDHATIQAAVTAAGGEDTILVAPGTFTEGVIVPTGKNGLKIQGANAGIPAGRVPGTRGPETVVEGGFLLRSDAVEIDGFTIEDGATLFGAGSVGGVTIGEGANDVVKNNIFGGDGGVTPCPYPAVHQSAAAGDGLKVLNNEMFGWCQGVFLNPSSGNVVEENNIHDNVVGIGSDGQTALTVRFNRFSGSTSSPAEAIGLGTAGPGIVINSNNFHFDGGINHYGGAQVDGSNNYWDCQQGPDQLGCTGIDGTSPGNVSFTPWLCSAYPNPGGLTNDVLGSLCPPLPPGSVVDHFACYEVDEKTKLPKDLTVNLVDQFTTQLGVKVKKADEICAPVSKNGEPVLDERVHLVCYDVKGNEKANARVLVTNQFTQGAEPQRLRVKDKIQRLCVPSTKEEIILEPGDDDDDDDDDDGD